LWRYKYRDAVQDRWRLVSNVLAGEGLIFGAKPRGSGVYAIKPYRSGNVPEDHLVWTFKEPAPDCTTPACYNGNLYVLDGMRARMVTCLDAKTGQQKWQGQLPDDDPYFASITAADGKLYCVSNSGLVVVLSAGDSEFKIISQAEFGEGPVVSAVAVADEHLFIRTAENLYCIGK
ncbi:MAG: PQQ-binding-like beta-propeller repeat protein, partial [Planctomycetes bacterium]|nr:PQQ-binding-like beta-propeller repeat protein [Planctomycetota bacterium]